MLERLPHFGILLEQLIQVEAKQERSVGIELRVQVNQLEEVMQWNYLDMIQNSLDNGDKVLLGQSKLGIESPQGLDSVFVGNTAVEKNGIVPA